MNAVEFTPWPKIGRLNKPVIITEKIDGTNAAVGIRKVGPTDIAYEFEYVPAPIDGQLFAVRAQSRKRFIQPGSDNFGFAAWVFENAETLVSSLGEGLHYGEWWGRGIQRTYGMQNRYFSLFNTSRWEGEALTPQALEIGVRVVPTLRFTSGDQIGSALNCVLVDLALGGSTASVLAEGKEWPTPEGVMTFWTASNTMFKYILDNPDTPKSAVA